MGLKAVVDSLEDVAEQVRQHYAPGDDGKYHLDIDGIEDHPGTRALKRALEAERESRRRASRRAEALRSEVERQANEAGGGAEDPQTVGGQNGDAPSRTDPLDPAIRTFVEERLAELERSRRQELGVLQEAYRAAEGSAEAARAELTREKLDNLILTAATESGTRREALPDVLARARETWSLDGAGRPVAQRNGKPIVGPEGETPLTVEGWLAALAQRAPHLFEPNRGGAMRGLQGALTTAETVVDRTRPNAIGRNLEAFARGEAKLA